jgi:glycosyltransferase involved in cell wall biosynthesis
MGVPVAVSDIPVDRELFRAGSVGPLVQQPDTASWASELMALLTDRDAALDRARRATALVDQMYRWDHVAERLDGAYEEALQGQ